MDAKKKAQCPIRLYEDTYEKVKVKSAHDRITFQKLVEVLLTAYLKNNKEVMRLVEKYADGKYTRRKNELDEMEREELLREIETNHSPLRALDQAIKEMQNE